MQTKAAYMIGTEMKPSALGVDASKALLYVCEASRKLMNMQCRVYGRPFSVKPLAIYYVWRLVLSQCTCI